MLINPVLAFIKAFRLHGSSEKLKHSTLCKFDSVIMVGAQKVLWERPEVAETLRAAGVTFQARHGSDKRSQAAAVLDDLLVAFDKLDELDKLPEIFCEANDLVKLPAVTTDTCTELVQCNQISLTHLEDHVGSLSESLTSLSSKVSEIKSQLSSYSSGQPCNQPASTPVASYAQATQASNASASVLRNIKNKYDCQENLVLFGVKEAGSIQDTMNRVKDILKFLVDDPPPVGDFFRLGRRKKPDSNLSMSDQSFCPRPLIIKLTSVWNWRLILANKYRLKEYKVKGIFIREDLSLEERAKRKLQHQSASSTGTTLSST